MSKSKVKQNNFATPLHLACAGKDENLRPIMHYVHFKNDFAYATNAHILVKQPLSYSTVLNYENLNGKMIHRDVFKTILKFWVVEAKEDGLNCYCKETGSYSFFEYANQKELGNAPDFESVLNNKNKATACIGIAPKFVEIADKCLLRGGYRDEYEALEFYFDGETGAMKIKVKNMPDQLALLMPLCIDEKQYNAECEAENDTEIAAEPVKVAEPQKPKAQKVKTVKPRKKTNKKPEPPKKLSVFSKIFCAVKKNVLSLWL